MATEFTIYEVDKKTDVSMLPFFGLRDARIIINIRGISSLYEYANIVSKEAESEYGYFELDMSLLETKEFKEFMLRLKEKSLRIPEEYKELEYSIKNLKQNKILVWNQC